MSVACVIVFSVDLVCKQELNLMLKVSDFGQGAVGLSLVS